MSSTNNMSMEEAVQYALRSDTRRNGFRNMLAILANIDRHELELAGIIKKGDHNAWGTFTRNPYTFFLKADDKTDDDLWSLIEQRQPDIYKGVIKE